MSFYLDTHPQIIAPNLLGNSKMRHLGTVQEWQCHMASQPHGSEYLLMCVPNQDCLKEPDVASHQDGLRKKSYSDGGSLTLLHSEWPKL